MIVHCMVAFLLTLFKGLFTGFSTAIRVLDLKKARYVGDGETERQQKLNNILEKIETYSNVASVMNALLGIGIGIYIVIFLHPLTEKMVSAINVFGQSQAADIISLVILICLFTYVFAFFSIVLPKFFANRYPDVISLQLLWLVKLFNVLLFPLVWIVDVSYNIMEKIFLKNADPEEVSEEEILMIVDAGGETGGIDEHEKEMINNIFDFDDKTVGEISTHRMDIVAMPVTATMEDIKHMILEEKYSRIPVYEDNIDNIIGIIYVKDFIELFLSGIRTFNITELIREPEFVPFNMKTDTLFEQMQRKKFHMAIVVDEYGGTAGIITMEDLIEEIMGNIEDEYDEEEDPDISLLDDHTMLIDGTTSLDDVAEQLDINMPVEEIDTLSGFIISMLGRIPEEGEKISLDYEGYVFDVEKIEEKRVALVKVYPKQEPEEEE